jgi:hypothetical protein
MKQRAPALPDSPTFQQLWDALGSRLIETAQEHLLYTQEVRGSSPRPLDTSSPLCVLTRHAPFAMAFVLVALLGHGLSGELYLSLSRFTLATVGVFGDAGYLRQCLQYINHIYRLA